MTGSPPAAAVRSTISRLARLVLADVLDRTRQPTYLVSLLAMLWVGQHMLPPLGAPYRTMTLDLFYRPAYNAAWVGTLTAVLTGVWFVLIGFYQVKGSVERDRRTGVGQILAATRVGTLTYLWVRTLGNFAVFASQAAMVILAALFQQQVLGEDRRVPGVPRSSIVAAMRGPERSAAFTSDETSAVRSVLLAPIEPPWIAATGSQADAQPLQQPWL